MTGPRVDVLRSPSVSSLDWPQAPLLPQYIPVEVCLTVGIDPTLPGTPDKCMAVVQSDIAQGGISAHGLPPQQLADLQHVVSAAADDGIDLKVVVLNRDTGVDTPLRDVATEVGQANPGSTVLVLSPFRVGTYSSTFDRVTLEAGEDLAKTGNPVQSTSNFVSQLKTPDFPWTGLTIGLTIGVLAAAVVTRLLRNRAKSTAPANPQVDAEISASPSASG